MRRYQQTQILEVLDTLKEAQSAGLYADCQDGAIGVGEYIEQIAGEGTRTVAMLEEYCELLYKASIGEVSEKLLKEHITSIDKSVRSELKPNRVEIVFLSYKASMSDSIESIYLAAKADPNCDAFWIPIPYFDRNADGSAGLTHYEGEDNYADYIECTHFRDYDIEARRPDAIFTFNPYDEANYVTSVHPDYYCERLRELTDMLVYVPYFVAADTVAEPYVTLPGCLYAHKVVVQSDIIRDSYIRHYRQNCGDEFGKPEDKFIALGSPKFDKVLNARREDFTLPHGWQKTLRGKKVVFYNTTVTTILACDEQYLRKLRYVIDVFRNREDIALWWRPHPLSEQTYASMRPELIEEYRRIVAEYQREGWGIYDESADLHGAIAWSDAYYGDFSSVAILYEAARKPVFYQSVGITDDCRNEKEHRINFFDFKVKDATLWGVIWEFNGLFSVSLNDNRLIYRGAIPEERTFDGRLYSSLSLLEDSIFLIPCSAKNISRYDLITNQFGLTPVEGAGKSKFFNSCEYAGDIYAIPYYYTALVKFNAETGEIDENRDIIIELERQGVCAGYFDKGGATVDGDVVMLASRSGNTVLKYNMQTSNFKLYNVGKTENKYTGIVFDGKDYWLFADKGGIVRWNEKDSSVKNIDELPDGFATGKTASFRCCVVYEGDVFVFPWQSNMILKINTATNEITTLANTDERNKHISFVPDTAKYLHAERVGDYIYASSAFENCLQKIDPRTGTIENVPLSLAEEDYEKIMDKSLFNAPSGAASGSWVNYENRCVSLPFFLERLGTEIINDEQVSLTDMNNVTVNTDGSCGAEICDYVLSCLLS